jgi:hypothetical protein
MPEDRMIDPAWLVKARRDRSRFAVRVIIVFAVLSILAWWALPRLEQQHRILEGTRIPGRTISAPAPPAAVALLAKSAGFFKVFWVGVAAGCGIAVLLGFTGKIDTLLPVFNLVLLLAGAGAVALTIYVFYAPTLLLIKG